MPKSVPDRFMAKVDKAGPTQPHMTTPCWIWTASASLGDYGKFWDGKLIGAHRWAYAHFVGPIPAGKSIDHRCHVHRCVNPEHLRPSDGRGQQENLTGIRSNSKSGIRGVRFTKGAWEANVKVGGKGTYLGRFATVEDAEQAAIEGRNARFTMNELDRRS